MVGRKFFLSLEMAISRLDREKIPIESESQIEVILDYLQDEMDNWFNQKLLPTVYQEKIRSNHDCNLFLGKYPVIAVQAVAMISPRMSVGYRHKSAVYHLPWLWDEQQTISVSCPGLYEVTYISGHEKLPTLFGEQQYFLLRLVLERGYSSIHERTKTLTNVNLPGGLSQGFERGKAPEKVGGTVLDEALYPLFRFRRKILC
jgi:hypothetical protein